MFSPDADITNVRDGDFDLLIRRLSGWFCSSVLDLSLSALKKDKAQVDQALICEKTYPTCDVFTSRLL